MIGGCDGVKLGRNYYIEFVEKILKDMFILMFVCGKYRFNKKDFGLIGEFLRFLDVG